jgi:hypothetical protein
VFIVVRRMTNDLSIMGPPAKRQKLESNANVGTPVSPVSGSVEVIDLLDSDDDNEVTSVSDEICIVAISEAQAIVLPMNSSTEDLDGDDDIQTAVLRTAAVYPHSRADCTVDSFVDQMTDSAHAVNKRACDLCYCCMSRWTHSNPGFTV